MRINSRHIKKVALLAVFGGILTVHASYVVAQACTDMATFPQGAILAGLVETWDWTLTGHWWLQQSSNGQITGYMITNATTCPPGERYNTVGSIGSAGNVSLVSTYTGSNSGCATTLLMNGTLTGPGCAVVNGSWTNSSGEGPMTFTMTHDGSYLYPSGESLSVFAGWLSDPTSASFQTAAVYNVKPEPTATYNWGGRVITEQFLQPPDDTCWFQGSPLPQANPTPAKAFTMTGNNGYADYVGPSQNAVNKYRKFGRTPCGFINYQTVFIDAPTLLNPSGSQPFATVTQIVDIGDVAVGVSRAGVAASRNWGAPAPIITLTPLMYLLFSK